MFNNEKLNKIFEKTDGCCHLCHSKLAFSNYGCNGARGGWHIEHSVPRFSGGSNHLNNLYPACIDCNLQKGTQSTRAFRTSLGKTRAPLSKEKKETIKTQRTIGGGLTGAGIGMLIGGPVGALVFGLFGALIGENSSPQK